MTYFTSRSRFEATQVCPRKRYLGHDYAGVGLEPARLSLPLAVGSAVHLGVEVLLKLECVHLPLWDTLQGILGDHEEFAALVDSTLQTMEPVDIAVWAALREFNEAFETHQVDATANESMIFIHDEQAALIEILLRLWAGHPDGLPWLLAEYEVLEVERWDLLPLVAGTPIPQGFSDEDPLTIILDERRQGLEMPNNPPMDPVWVEYWQMPLEGLEKLVAQHHVPTTGGITLRSRADALLRRRSDGGLYVWSLKTANQYDRRKREDQRHDVQGISEMLAVERRLVDEWLKPMGIETAEQTAAALLVPKPRVDGTQMTYMIKGRRDLNEELNVYQLKSWLVHPWFIAAGLLGEKQYAHTYWYSCEQPHDTGRRLKNGSAVMCEGGKKHNIGTSWQQCNVWEHMTAAEWVQLILSGDMQPGLPMPSPFVNPEVMFRNQEEVDDWVEQATAQESRAVEGLRLLEGTDDPEVKRRLLNVHFPQHRRSCTYPTKCPFTSDSSQTGVCWAPPALAEDPVGSGLFRLRTPVSHEGSTDNEVV